jgi:hypothetical protein
MAGFNLYTLFLSRSNGKGESGKASVVTVTTLSFCNIESLEKTVSVRMVDVSVCALPA